MANNLNRCEFIGRLGKDPEMRHTGAGKKVCSFSVAVNRSWTKDGEKMDITEWINIVAWDKLAEICGKYLKKGSQVYVAGEMRSSTWDKADGSKGYKTDIQLRDMQMLDIKTSRANTGTTPLDDDFELPF